MSKPKVAFYWCASCGGCEEAIVDLDEQLLEVAKAVDIVFWPCAMDFKRHDVEAMADGEIAVSFINGAIRTSEQEEMARLLRRKSGLVIAYGACAHLGGVPGLANLTRRDDILDLVYRKVPTINDDTSPIPQAVNIVPEGEIELPRLFGSVWPLDRVIDVDYYLPGCPPTPKLTWRAIEAILSGELPEKGSVLAGDRALCSECALNATKPEKLLINDLKRVQFAVPEPDKCLLAQGLLCLGPVTRSGCEALCIKGNMPCTGCFGPLDQVYDFGGKALSAISSILDYQDEPDVRKAVNKVVDPAGTFYRYSLPSSFLGQGERSQNGHKPKPELEPVH